MKDKVFDEIIGIFEITEDTHIEFKEIYGFTFVFMTKIVTFRNRISSAEIQPAGIIYEENGEYYFAPLYRADNIDEIVKEYVEKIIMEGECPHFPQQPQQQ